MYLVNRPAIAGEILVEEPQPIPFQRFHLAALGLAVHLDGIWGISLIAVHPLPTRDDPESG